MASTEKSSTIPIGISKSPAIPSLPRGRARTSPHYKAITPGTRVVSAKIFANEENWIVHSSDNRAMLDYSSPRFRWSLGDLGDRCRGVQRVSYATQSLHVGGLQVKIISFFLTLLAPAAFAQESHEALLHHWDYDQHTPLNMKQTDVQKRDGVSIYDISFASPVGNRSTSVGPNGRIVTAYLVVPVGPGPFPAVIYGHWCMPGSEKRNRTEFLEEAIVLAHSGVLSLLPDHVIVHPGLWKTTDR